VPKHVAEFLKLMYDIYLIMCTFWLVYWL